MLMASESISIGTCRSRTVAESGLEEFTLQHSALKQSAIGSKLLEKLMLAAAQNQRRLSNFEF